MHAIPRDFEQALKQNRLHDFFHECAYVHRAGYLSWVLTPVRPENRHLRIQQAVVRLQAQQADVLAAARKEPPAAIHRPAVRISLRSGPADTRQSA